MGEIMETPGAGCQSITGWKRLNIIWHHFFLQRGAVVMHHSSLYLECSSTDGMNFRLPGLN